MKKENGQWHCARTNHDNNYFQMKNNEQIDKIHIYIYNRKESYLEWERILCTDFIINNNIIS